MHCALQVKHELVKFNPRIKSDYISLDDLLVDLQLSPTALEVPIPNYFREDELGTTKTLMELIDAAYEQHHVEYVDDDTVEVYAALGGSFFFGFLFLFSFFV